MVLVDTSVWVDHLRRGNRTLRELLEQGQVLCHPLVIGELACGNLGNRAGILVLLRTLPQARTAEDDEVFHLIDTHRLYGRGLGWIDLHLLASAVLSKCALWTLDRQLQRTAHRLEITGR